MKMLQYVGLVLALLTGPLAAASIQGAKPEEAGFSSERLARIQQTVKRHIDAHDIAGAVTLVARRGRIAHFEARGFGLTVQVVSDAITAGYRVSDGSYGWDGAFGTFLGGIRSGK
jgi:hypothetical protein